jgi:putative SOS response-associated peptidase YedK
MCARFTLTAPARDLADLFSLPEVPALESRYNIAPTQAVAAVRRPAGSDGPELVRLRWGLVPSWAADLGIGNRLLNARAETVADKPAFRAAFARRRCLIPADGFYEWRGVAGKKLPVCFRLRDGRPFAFAGLWERWLGGDGRPVETCAILTTQANDLVAPVHERMPVILSLRQFADWLDPRRTDPSGLRPWLRPFPADQMSATAVSTHVNNPRNEGPRCLVAASS